MRCDRCHLCHTAKTVKVESRGPTNAEIMIVGQAPGPDEDKNGVAFDPHARAAGHLHKLLIEVGFDPLKIRFTNVTRCIAWTDDDRAKGFRDPTTEEIEKCVPYLWEEIFEVNPKIIIPVGNISAKVLAKQRKSITQIRGTVYENEFEWNGVKRSYKVLPTIHPSAAIRQYGNDYTQLILTDLKYAHRIIHGDTQVTTNYKLLESIEDLRTYITHVTDLWRRGECIAVAVDIETPMNVRFAEPTARILSIQFSHEPHQGVMFLVDHPNSSVKTPVDYEDMCAILRPFFKNVPIVGQNFLFDAPWLWVHTGARSFNLVFDTMLGSYFLFGDTRPYGLEYMAARYLDMHNMKGEMSSALAQLPKDRQSMEYVNMDIFVRYGCGDVDATLQLAHKFKEELVRTNRWNGYKVLYIDTFSVFCEMKAAGFKLDEIHLAKLKQLYPQKMSELYSQMTSYGVIRAWSEDKERQTGKPIKFNPNSTDHMAEILYSREYFGFDAVEAGFEKSKKWNEEETPWAFTTNRQARTEISEFVASKIGGENSEFYKDVLQLLDIIDYYKRIVKLHGTYVVGIEENSIHWRGQDLDSRTNILVRKANQIPFTVHPNIKLSGARTGRISMEDPPLHQLPNSNVKLKAMADLIRLVKILFPSRWADIGGCILEFDLSQMELRVLAMLADEKNMASVFARDGDIHRFVASHLNKVTEDQVTSSMRRFAKTGTFGIIYGQGAKGLAAKNECSEKEAAALINKIKHEIFPGIGRYEKLQHSIARDHGMVYNPYHRIRFLEDIKSKDHGLRAYAERQALNSPIQGTASDMNIEAMGRTHNELRSRGLKSICVNTVHDSQVWDIYPGELFEVAEAIHRHQLVMPAKIYDWCNVKLDGEFGIGQSWGNTMKVEFDFYGRHIHLAGRVDNLPPLIAQIHKTSSQYEIASLEEYEDKEQGESVKVDMAFAAA